MRTSLQETGVKGKGCMVFDQDIAISATPNNKLVFFVQFLIYYNKKQKASTYH